MRLKLLSLLILLVFSGRIYAQEKKDSFVKFRGNIGLYYDLYTYTEDNYADFRAKYPDNIFRLNASASLSFGKYFVVPISVNVTNQKVLFTYPKLPQGNIVDYITNPKNQISINPRYKWIQGYIGTQRPQYSELTTGDVSLFGLGINLTPRGFIFSASHGVSQVAIEPNAAFNMEGAYKQNMTAFRIGVGSETGSKFTLNVVRLKDDVNSITEKPLQGKPIEGITISPLLELQLFKKIFLKTETAASIFTDNIENDKEIDAPIVNKIKDFITINATSHAGIAHTSSLMWKSKGMMFGGEIKFASAGFIPVGYRNAERDYLDYKLKTALQLLNGTTYLTASAGIRTNNLQNTTIQSTKRFIGNLSVNSRIGKRFIINATYANFGFKNSNGLTQQEKVEITNNTFSLSPSYTFQSKRIRHTINLTTSLMSYKQFEAVSNDYVKTKSKNLSVNYGMFFKQIPLTTRFLAMILANETPTMDMNIKNLGTSVGYRFFKKKLQTTVDFNFVSVKKGEYTADNRFTSKVRIGYKITQKINFTTTYRFNRYAYGSIRPDARTNEQRIQFALTTRF